MSLRHAALGAALPGVLCVPAHADDARDTLARDTSRDTLASGDARDIRHDPLAVDSAQAADRAVARGAGAGRIR
ncbi:hypothetical protein AB0K92_15685 [Streptomyces sp. NPDC052687]|uniref:hypothetical protein n=1 Tax=Streptomyces sp. NPDC052687 TaxID=3154759 RepID=UPI003430131A